MESWRENLSSFFENSEKKSPTDKEARSELAVFISDVVVPAFSEVSEELRQHGRETSVRSTDAAATILITCDGDEEMTYRVQGRMFPNGIRPFAEVRFRERKGHRYITIESMFRASKPTYAVSDLGKGEIIQDLLKHYMQRVRQD